eukprot:167330_1
MYTQSITAPIIILILICFIRSTKSQTDVSSFGIFASSESASTTSTALRLLLSWNREQWECIINDTMLHSTQCYMCTSGDFEPNATLISSALSSDTYEMKIELLNKNSDDFLRIHTIRVLDYDVNYYDIDTFCVPSAFKRTAARGSTSNRERCYYWTQRFSFNNYAMSSAQNVALKISYAQFRSNVLNDPNQAHEGAIKPPMVTELRIKTLDEADAASSSDYILTLHWDTLQYLWSLQPNEINQTFTKTYSDSDAFCEFFSGFGLEITASTADLLGIDTIIIKDESEYHYIIDTFCPSDHIEASQLYNNLGKQCESEWPAYSMYGGFIYNGSSAIFITADDRLFLNTDHKQQGVIVSEDYFPSYSCTSNDVEVITPRAFTLFKDNMNDPISTGWTFNGTYRENVNAGNCPSGSGSTCSQLEGHEGSTTIDSSMQITVDVSDYINLVDISIQYDLTLSTMPSGKSCYVYYAFDGGVFVTANTYTGSGVNFQSFLSQTFTIPDHRDLEFKNITIKFLNNALYRNEYCYIDEVYIFVGDRWLEYDDCGAFDSSWTYSGATIGTSYCHSGSCIYLTQNSYYALKTFDISNYNNLILRIDFKFEDICYVYYFYDNEPESLLGSVSSGTTDWRTYSNQEFSVPDSKICGASTLSIRFRSSGYSSAYDCTIDNIVLLGNIVDPTVIPTAHPTTNPTAAPIFPTTMDPSHSTSDYTANPTTNQITNPTADPIADQTVNPAVESTAAPNTIETMDPTVYSVTATTKDDTVDTPTVTTYFPTLGPTEYSTTVPTNYRTLDHVHSDQTSMESTLLTIAGKDRVSDANTGNSKTFETLFAVSCVVVFCLLLLMVLLIKIGKMHKKQNKTEYTDVNKKDVIEMCHEGKGDAHEVTALKNDDEEDVMQKLLDRQQNITNWFQNHVKLEESNQKYYSLFMKDGYDQMSLIAELTNENLIDMGIDKKAHRKRIMKAVELLNNTDYHLFDDDHIIREVNETAIN